MSHLPDVYAIIKLEAAAAVDYSQVGETSIDTIRMNIALTEFVLKWEHEHEPTFITDRTIVPFTDFNTRRSFGTYANARME